MSLVSDLQILFSQAKAEIASATSADYEALRIKYLGRKSHLSELLATVASLPADKKAEAGKVGNQVKRDITKLLGDLQNQKAQPADSSFDPTMPPLAPRFVGRLHPLTETTNELLELFRSLGFDLADGPEVELEKYNFDLLNLPDDHPARDEWDTFWIKRVAGGSANTLLRTHTSPVQVRYMQNNQPPIRVVVPGRTFRYEAEDATHSSVFYQLEGLMIDRNITIQHLKATLELIARRLLGDDAQIRLRPSFFPFTEPSFEVDVWFRGKWLELCGAGMVHPNVLRNGNIDPEIYSGFAFGLGIDRLTMLKHNLKDIRVLHEPDPTLIARF